jgi:hypothetical protein
LITVVIREFSEWQPFLPRTFARDKTSPKHVFKNLINTLNLPRGLWMIGRTADSMSAKILMQVFPETSRELRSSIENSGFGHTMETYHLLELNVNIHMRMIVRLDRNKMSEFG